jgi:hypothetical protein
VLAVSYCRWFVDYAANPLWTDELITIALVKSTSLKHLFSAVLLGLDATPPLYTSYGWFMLHNVVPGVAPELLLRITNAGLIAGTIWVLYLLVRQFFDRVTAVAIGAFILLELWQLKFLTLEVRTYAALTLSKEPFPYPDISDPLARIFDAWGFDRCCVTAHFVLTFANHAAAEPEI